MKNAIDYTLITYCKIIEILVIYSFRVRSHIPFLTFELILVILDLISDKSFLIIELFLFIFYSTAATVINLKSFSIITR